MSVGDAWFTFVALATVIGYGTLVWLGMTPERALGFVVGGAVVIGLLSRAAIGVLTPDVETLSGAEPSDPRGSPVKSPGRLPVPVIKPASGEGH